MPEIGEDQTCSNTKNTYILYKNCYISRVVNHQETNDSEHQNYQDDHPNHHENLIGITHSGVDYHQGSILEACTSAITALQSSTTWAGRYFEDISTADPINFHGGFLKTGVILGRRLATGAQRRLSLARKVSLSSFVGFSQFFCFCQFFCRNLVEPYDGGVG